MYNFVVAIIGTLLLFRVIDCDAATQPADEVLVQIVNQVDHAPRIADTADAKGVDAAREPRERLSCRVKRLANAKYFGRDYSDYVAVGIEDRGARESIPNGTLENDRVYRFGTEECLQPCFGGHCTLEHYLRPVYRRVASKNGNCVAHTGSFQASHFHVRQIGGVDQQSGNIEIGLIRGDAILHGDGGIRLLTIASKYDYLYVGCVFGVLGCGGGNV